MLEVTQVSRHFGPQKYPAVVDVSLKVEPGKVHALLGPNGAGKTTTVRMCATLLRPSSGSVTVAGIDAIKHPARARRELGLVLGGDLGFYPRASCLDNLLYFADLQGVPGRQRRARAQEVLEQVGLVADAAKPTQALSRGLKQRLHIARALLNAPGILLLDEPTVGMDPDVSLRIRDLVRDIAAAGTGILLTSHSMPEVEELASEITLIGAGRTLTNGGVADIARAAGIGLVSSFKVPAAAAGLDAALSAQLSPHFSGVAISQRPQGAHWAVEVYWPAGQKEPAAVEAHLLAALDAVQQVDGLRWAGAPVAELLTRPATLEQAYLAIAERLVR